jgi:hypothetical protein
LIEISPDTLSTKTFAKNFPGPSSSSAMAVGLSGLSCSLDRRLRAVWVAVDA